MINKFKRQPSEWEKVVANEATDKGLISKIYKQFIQLNIRKTNSPIKKQAEDLNRHFSKEDKWPINSWKDDQNHSLSEKCKSKLQWGISSHKNKTKNNKCWRGCEEKGIFLHCWWECKLIQPLKRIVWRFLDSEEKKLPWKKGR